MINCIDEQFLLMVCKHVKESLEGESFSYELLRTRVEYYDEYDEDMTDQKRHLLSSAIDWLEKRNVICGEGVLLRDGYRVDKDRLEQLTKLLETPLPIARKHLLQLESILARSAKISSAYERQMAQDAAFKRIADAAVAEVAAASETSDGNRMESVKDRDRRCAEQMDKQLKEASLIYIDGNNLCWDNRGEEGKFIGIARIDRIIKEMKSEKIRSAIPNAKIMLFFDYGIIYNYRRGFVQMLNDGNVVISNKGKKSENGKKMKGDADKAMLDMSESNGDTERTFIITNDNFEEVAFRNYSVVKGGRVLKSFVEDYDVLIPELDIGFEFNPDTFAHLPLRKMDFNGEISIRACCNGKYLCANDDGDSSRRPIRADRDNASEWEKFNIVGNDDGTVSVRSKANGKYLTADAERLIAQADIIASKEKFWLTKRIKEEQYALRSYDNMKYVSANPDTGAVGALVDVADAWEWFDMRPQ